MFDYALLALLQVTTSVEELQLFPPGSGAAVFVYS
jgi:hypothetical protein